MKVKLGILTDVHADIERLRPAVGHLRALGADLIMCAGDLVDYGHFPNETISFLKEQQIPCIYGNHDRWALADNGVAQSLSLASLAFLDSLGPEWRCLIAETRIVAWHSQPKDTHAMKGLFPENFLTDGHIKATAYLERASADVLIVGHTHLSFEVRTRDNRLIVNPGALWQPEVLPPSRRERDIRRQATDSDLISLPRTDGGRFGVLDLPARTFRVYDAVEFSEVPHRVVSAT